MPSSYSTRLRFELQATGENRATWGNKANGDFNLVEAAIAGASSIVLTDADHTLTTVNGATDEARSAILIVTGTLTAARTITIPTVTKTYVIANFTTGGFAVNVKTSAITPNTIAIANTATQYIWTDATNCYFAGATNKADVGLANVDNTSDVNKPVSTATSAAIAAATIGALPIGSTLIFPQSTAPAGYLKINGALLSRTTYAALWTYAQTTGNIAASDAVWTSSTLFGQFSPGDGSTTFRMPDSRGFFIRGFSDGSSEDTGRTIGSRQLQALLNHFHGASADAQGNHAHGLNDPGHAHLVPAATNNGTANGQAAIAGNTSGPDWNWHTDGAFTGMSVANAGTHSHNITVGNVSTGTVGETRPDNIAWPYYMKYQ